MNIKTIINKNRHVKTREKFQAKEMKKFTLLRSSNIEIQNMVNKK